MFFVIGIAIVIPSAYFQATTIAYVGLGLIFWGLIISFIVTEIPSKRKDECSTNLEPAKSLQQVESEQVSVIERIEVQSDSEGDVISSEVPEQKPMGLLVTKAEIFDNTVWFFVEKGRLKKRRIIVKQIPVDEITRIESFGNKLSVSWKTVTDTFFTNENAELFINLSDEVNRILAEQQKLKNSWKVALRRNELLAVIDASIGIIDFSFNILMGVKKKRINWEHLKNYSSQDLLDTFSFTGKLMPPLNVGFLKISSAIKSQIPEKTSKEAFNILKVIYIYFDSLNLDNDFKESVPNFLNTKAIISSYFTLNYLLLGKVVGEKENDRDFHQLEGVLQNLTNNTNFRVNIEALKASIDKVVPESDSENVIDSSREIFKEQFLSLVFKSL